MLQNSFKVFWSFFPSSSFNFCSDFVGKYFEITKNPTKPGLKRCTWEETSQTKMSCRTCSSLDLKDRTHGTIYSKSDEFVFVIDGLTKTMAFYPEYFNNPKTLKNGFCLQEDRVCSSARAPKTKGKGLDSVYRHYVWSKRISKPKVLLKRGVNKVEMIEWTGDVRGSGWRRRGSEAAAQKLRTMGQFCSSTLPI